MNTESTRNNLQRYQQTLIARYYNDKLSNEMKLFLNKIIDEIGELLTPSDHTADQIQDSESQNPAGSDGVIKTESTKPEDKEIVEFQKTLPDSRTLDEKIAAERFVEIQRLKDENASLNSLIDAYEGTIVDKTNRIKEIESELERLKKQKAELTNHVKIFTEMYAAENTVLFDWIQDAKFTLQNSGQ